MNNRNRNLLLAGIAGVLLILCCCLVGLSLLAGSLFITRSTQSQGPQTNGPVQVVTVVPSEPQAEVTAEATRLGGPGNAAAATQPAVSIATPTALSSSSGSVAPATGSISSTESLLANTDVPQRDLRELAMRLKPDVGDIPTVVNQTPPAYKVGDSISFWTENSDTQEHHHISATLRYITPHVYVWVEKGVQLDDKALATSADRFENKTYPTDREFFGSEWTPGVDNDVHLNILHARDLGDNIAGYYSSADEFSHLVNPYSNEKEMFYISADPGGAEPNTSFYDGVLAHEFQHMIHWNNDRNEESWINEGMSELAAHLNGFDVGGADIAFARRPDTQLDTWNDPSLGNAEHYGASYLFMDYFLGRFGENLTKAVVADKENGIAGFNDALAKAGRAERFNDIFADWVVANYLNRPDVEPKGQFGYVDIKPPAPALAKTYDRLPAADKSEVSQYGTDYIQVKRPGNGDLTVKFSGQTSVGLVDTTPHGKYAWWSNRGDDSDATLTRAFDLTGLKSATLNFSAWWNIEDGWDYVYVEGSTDGGKHWQLLRGRQSSDKDKSGNAFGPGWTGMSGGGKAPQWVDERVDLSQFAGQKILLRFEYVTDDAVNGPGFLLDDIRIPELNFEDQGETGANGWQAAGWVLTDNTLTEHWLVQVITAGNNGVQVQRLDVGADGQGQVTIKNAGGLDNLMLMVSALAPVTTESTSYSYNVTTP